MDVLELDDPEAGDWLAEYHPLERPAKRPASPEAGGLGSSRKRAPLRAPAPSGRVHLLVGCSIARDSLMDIVGADIIYNKAKGGETWSRLRFTFQATLFASNQLAKPIATCIRFKLCVFSYVLLAMGL